MFDIARGPVCSSSCSGSSRSMPGCVAIVRLPKPPGIPLPWQHDELLAGRQRPMKCRLVPLALAALDLPTQALWHGTGAGAAIAELAMKLTHQWATTFGVEHEVSRKVSHAVSA